MFTRLPIYHLPHHQHKQEQEQEDNSRLSRRPTQRGHSCQPPPSPCSPESFPYLKGLDPVPRGRHANLHVLLLGRLHQKDQTVLRPYRQLSQPPGVPPALPPAHPKPRGAGFWDRNTRVMQNPKKQEIPQKPQSLPTERLSAAFRAIAISEAED